jgi:hypothetical protein
MGEDKNMKKLAALFLLTLSVAALVSCSISPAAAIPAHYTQIEQMAQLPYTKDILGIAPDGSYLVFINDQQIGTYPIDARPSASTQPLAALPVNQGTVLPNRKQAQWSADGKSFLLSDIDATSVELLYFASRNISLFSVAGNHISTKTVTDEDTKTSALKGGFLVYAPSFSYDGKGVVYSTMSVPGGTNVFKADIQSGQKQTLYHTGDKVSVRCLELAGNLSFVCENGAQSGGTNSLFFIDSNKNVTRLQDESLGLGGLNSVYDIKSWSGDRRALLITRWKTGGSSPAIDAFFILKPGIKPADYQLKPYPMDAGRLCLNAVLSADGNTVITCETADGSKTRDLVLYDVSADTKTTLLSSDTLFGSAGALNGNHESIYFTKNGKLLVWFIDGYRLYQMK